MLIIESVSIGVHFFHNCSAHYMDDTFAKNWIIQEIDDMMLRGGIGAQGACRADPGSMFRVGKIMVAPGTLLIVLLTKS